VFENRVQQKVFLPERGEVTGGWRKLRDEELHDLYPSSDMNRILKSRTKCAKHVTSVVGDTYQVLVVKPEEQRALESYSSSEYNIKMDLKELGWRAG
jgi:hypothetical protein